MDVESFKEEVKTSVEVDARNNAQKTLRHICKKRGGKFKISEKQFTDEIENMWIAAEFSAAERILRCIEIDTELNSRDLITGEIHIFIMDLFKVLKKKMDLKHDLDLMDMIDGRFSTRVIEASRIKRENNEIRN